MTSQGHIEHAYRRVTGEDVFLLLAFLRYMTKGHGVIVEVIFLAGRVSKKRYIGSRAEILQLNAVRARAVQRRCNTDTRAARAEINIDES